VCLKLDDVHTRQSSALSLSNSMPTMEVAMLVHSIEKIVSVCYFLLLDIHTHSHFTALFLWLSGKPVPEEEIWCKEDNKGRHTDNLAGCHSTQTNQQPISIIPHFYAGCPSCRNPPNLSWLGTGTKYAGLHIQWLGCRVIRHVQQTEWAGWSHVTWHWQMVEVMSHGVDRWLKSCHMASTDGWSHVTWRWQMVEVMSHGVDRCDIFWVNVEIVVLQAVVQSPSYHVACNLHVAVPFHVTVENVSQWQSVGHWHFLISVSFSVTSKDLLRHAF